MHLRVQSQLPSVSLPGHSRSKLQDLILLHLPSVAALSRLMPVPAVSPAINTSYYEGSFAVIEVHAVIPVMWTVKTVKTVIF